MPNNEEIYDTKFSLHHRNRKQAYDMFFQMELRKTWVCCLLMCVVTSWGKSVGDTLLIQRVFDYRNSLKVKSDNSKTRKDSLYWSDSIEGDTTIAYLKFRMKTDRRNVTLNAVPRLYSLMKTDRRNFVGESIDTIVFHEYADHEQYNIVRFNTMRHQRMVMKNLLFHLTPNIYGHNLFADHILSPFHRANQQFYRYQTTRIEKGRARIDVKARTDNIQLVSGHAIIDIPTGRIIECTLWGEYDLVSFVVNYEMGAEGHLSLLPQRCCMKTRFVFLGSKVRGIYEATFGLPHPHIIPLKTEEDHRKMIEQYRPYPIDSIDKAIYSEYDSINAPPPPMETEVPLQHEKKKIDFVEDILWDIIGYNMWNRISGHFSNDRGYYRFSPLFNPLYMGYSDHRGFYYRLTLRAGYDFSNNSSIYTSSKLSYSFKQQQLYANIPITFTFDERHHGYIESTFRFGDRITNSTVIDKLKEEKGDTVNWDGMNLDYFRQSHISLIGHYDINSYFGFQVGAVWNQWNSIDKLYFEKMNKPTYYHSSAVMGELIFRPLGWYGPIFSFNYEQTLKSMSKKRMNYKKWEADVSYLFPMSMMRSLSLRAGAGGYITNMNDTYFLDYNNFRDENIPGGWNDEWTGNFELLHSNWYNTSSYYVRFNATYESPMLILSWLPIAGKWIEKERFYVSVLKIDWLNYYTELGYGMTNQLFSMGLFTSFTKNRFESIGVKFGFELFDKW